MALRSDTRGRGRTTAAATTASAAALVWWVYRYTDQDYSAGREILARGEADDWAGALRAAERSAGWDRIANPYPAAVPDSVRGLHVAVRRTASGRVTAFPMI